MMTKSPIASPWGCAALSLALMSGPVLTAQSQTPADGGGQHEHGTQPQSGSSHGTAQHEPAMKGMTDAHFVQMMLKHHQQGIEMARIEEKGGASAEVKALATKIRQSQEREMAELKAHGKGAGEGAAATSGHEGHAKMDKMMDQQSQATMQRLGAASGEQLDRAFLEEMAKHHQMAINMSEHTTFKDAELRKLSEKMAAGQKQELAELKKLGAGKSKTN